MNGSSGLYWYRPLVSSRSGKFTPAAATSIRTSLGAGLRLRDVGDHDGLGPVGARHAYGAHQSSFSSA